MKTKVKTSAPSMLQWQYKAIIKELGQVTLHASSDDCPCNQVDLGKDGKHHPEYCLAKHLLNVNSLCEETALMDEPNKGMLEDMASEANKHQEAAKAIYCKGGTWPDLAQWARDARKKIEPLYFSCNVKLKEDAETVKLFESPRTIRVAGTYKSGAYNFKVSHTTKTEALTNTVEALPETISDVLRRISEKKQEVSSRTFAFGTTGLIRYEFFYRIVDGEKLIASNDPFTFEPNPNYPRELQPRIRERAAAELQVKTIAANIIPDVLLVDFRSTDRGAPIIGDDGVVESGNGRVMALVLASRDAPTQFAQYVGALKRIAPAYALDPRDADKFKVPILVRERLTPVNRKDFAYDCNAPVAMEQSAIEKAQTDAEKVTVTMLQSIQVNEGQSVEDAIRSPSNKSFVTAFLNKLPQNEQAKLFDAEGNLNSDGLRRIILAMFVATLKGKVGLKLAEAFFESTDSNVKNVLNGITGSLGILAQAEGLCLSGARYADYAIGADLAAAVTQFSNIKKTPGMTVAKYLAQQEMIARRLTPFQERILEALDEQSRSGKRIAAMLSLYAQKVIDSAPPGQAAFMIQGERYSKEELFDSAVKQIVVELEAEREVARQKAEAKREPAMVAEEPARLFERFTIKSKHPQPYGPIEIEFIPVRRGQKEFVKAMAKNKRGEVYRASSSDISDVTDKLFFQNETDYIGVERLKAWLSGAITDDQASVWTLGQIRNYLGHEKQAVLFETARLRQQLKFMFDKPKTETPLPLSRETETSCPPICPVVSRSGKTFELFDFQKEGVAWLSGRSYALLADEMGLGKTPQGIFWGAERRPVLVVVPSALVLNWAREIGEMWRPDDSVLVLDGKQELPISLPDWTVMSYGMLNRYLPALKRAGFKSIIIDEAHQVKNLDTQRTKNILKLVAPDEPEPGDKIIPNRIAITGTPILNRPIELFALMVFLGVKQRYDYRDYLRTYTESKVIKGRTVFTGAKNLYGLHQVLKAFMLRRLKKDVLKQLPPKINTTLFVPITNVDEYREAENNFLSWMREKKGDVAAIRAASAELIVKLNSLRQLAAEGKVEPVADWLKPCGDGQGKVIIFCSFTSPLERLAKIKGDSVFYSGALDRESRQQAVDDFQESEKYCYFMGTVIAAGVGITLTAANRVAFLDLPWTPGGKIQAEDRAHRIGQTRTVEIVNVLAKGTVDERMLKLLAAKEYIIAQAVDGKTRDEATSSSIAAGLIDDYLKAPNLNETCEQYEGELAEPPVNAVDADTLEILQGLREEPPAQLFEKVSFAEKGYYLVNLETGKMEIYFDKASYLALPEDLRKAVKSYFLFSRSKGAWVSKGQADSYMPQEIIKRLGFEKQGETGEKLPFAKKIEQRAERAEAKAKRYEQYAGSASQRSKQLQSDWRKYSQDLAFVTQPGRFPFRDKVIARFERGIEEGIKAQHFADVADRLNKSSEQSQLRNPTYLDNRIREGEAELRKIDSDAKEYETLGREVPDRLHQRAEEELEKLLYYKKAMADIGGITYNQDNVKKGDRVKIRHGWGIVKSTGPKNLTVVIAEGGAKGMELKYSYAEIREHKPMVKIETPFTTKDTIFPEKQVSSGQARLFEYSWLSQKIDKCNLSVRDVDAALNWRPLRNIVAAAVGVGAKVSLCSIGLVYGMYQLTIDNLTIDAEDRIAKLVMKTTNIKRIYTPIEGQRVYEVVVPREMEKTELTFAPQEVSMMPARKEPAEQVAMFEGREARLSDVFTVKMKVFSRDKKSFKEYDATVDTGADWCGIPEDDIKDLDLDYYGTLPTQTPKEIYEPGYYFGQVEVEGVRAAGLFAVSNYPIVGARFLQFGGFKVNPVEHKLERIPFMALGSVTMSESKNKLPVCTVEQIGKRERLILKMKQKNIDAGCPTPEGTGSKKCPTVFAVATKVVACRPGSTKLSEPGDTIKITGRCPEGDASKCVLTLKRVGNSVKVIGTQQLSRAIKAPELKEESVPANIAQAIRHPVEVKA